jgi:hypothetical protein
MSDSRCTVILGFFFPPPVCGGSAYIAYCIRCRVGKDIPHEDFARMDAEVRDYLDARRRENERRRSLAK